jgi:hypothetical protein
VTVHSRIDLSRKPEKINSSTVAQQSWKSGNPASFAGFPNEVEKSDLMTFPRSDFSMPARHAAANADAQ